MLVRPRIVLVRNRATAFAVIGVILVTGVCLVALPVVVFPPTSDIPEPYFSYMNSDAAGLFQYVDIGEGVTVNPLEIVFEFPAVSEGVASLRLDYVNLSVWVYDATTDQLNSSLILLLGASVITASEDVLTANWGDSDDIVDGWWCCGTYCVDLQERIGSSGTALSIGLELGVVNINAPDYEGDQILLRISADVGYAALWYWGALRAPYRTALFNFTVAEGAEMFLERVE